MIILFTIIAIASCPCEYVDSIEYLYMTLLSLASKTKGIKKADFSSYRLV